MEKRWSIIKELLSLSRVEFSDQPLKLRRYKDKGLDSEENSQTTPGRAWKFNETQTLFIACYNISAEGLNFQ